MIEARRAQIGVRLGRSEGDTTAGVARARLRIGRVKMGLTWIEDGMWKWEVIILRALRLPLLIFRESDVSGGIFDIRNN